jgi:tRNA modification GTPase
MANDVIAAVATAPGRGGIGVVRVSGPGLQPMLQQLVSKAVPPRRAAVAKFRDARGDVIDEGLALFFPAPTSYTGEDVIELHGHGGPVVMQLLRRRCLELGARLADPGEFTRRAFLNDKLDLAQAESVADLIDATTETAARCAVRSLAGEFSRAIDELVQGLTELRMFVEATLDFPEEDVEFIEAADARGKLAAIAAQHGRIMAAAREGSLLREGIHAVIIGQPNVGKSSLLNRLAGEELAIVTDVPGTTRDPIRQAIEIGGVPLHVIDTAGLRESADPVESIGIARTWDAIAKADLALHVIDAARPETAGADDAIVARLPGRLPRLRVLNKIDLVGATSGRSQAGTLTEIALSAKTGEGLEALRTALLEAVGWTGHGEGVYMARERHLDALRAAGAHLERAAEVMAQLELFAEELRLAQNALASITGEFTPDDLLGEIFSRFCIGK